MDTLDFALLFPDQRSEYLRGEAPWAEAGLRAWNPKLVLAPEFLAAAPKSQVDVKDWATFCRDTGTSAIVGELHSDEDDWKWNLARVFTPAGRYERTYAKHSTAHSVAWERDDYSAASELASFHLPDIGRVAPIICHDGYLGGIVAKYAEQRPRLFVNLTGSGVKPEKWLSIQRLRALEHRVPVICTMSYCDGKPLSGPFGFDADGQALELSTVDQIPVSLARPGAAAGTRIGRVSLEPTGTRSDALQRLPPADKVIRPNTIRAGTIQVRLEGGQLRAVGRHTEPIETPKGPKTFEAPLVVRLEEDELFDYWAIFNALRKAEGRRVVFHSAWRRLPAPADRMAHVLLGRCLENLSPFVLTDARTIYEVVEIAGAAKVMRRTRCAGPTAWVDLRYALGLKNAMKMIGDRDSLDLARRSYRAWSSAPAPRTAEPEAPSREAREVAESMFTSARAEGLSDQDLRDDVWRWSLAREHASLPSLLPADCPLALLEGAALESAYTRHVEASVDVYGLFREPGDPHWCGRGARCCGIPMQSAATRGSVRTCALCCSVLKDRSPPLTRSAFDAATTSLRGKFPHLSRASSEVTATGQPTIVSLVREALSAPHPDLPDIEYTPTELVALKIHGVELEDA